MYSVFESWMVTEYHRLHMDFNGGNLSEMFGTMTTLNGAVAIIAGIWAQEIADLTGTQAAPFMSSICLLVVAFVLILNKWVSDKLCVAEIELVEMILLISWVDGKLWRECGDGDRWTR